jgi:putative endonuclease
MGKTYCVYILASTSRNLYTGVTNNLQRRLAEHRNGPVPGFTSRYRVFRLVHYEMFGSIHLAIAREKEIVPGKTSLRNGFWAASRRPRQQQIPHPRPKAGRVRDDSVTLHVWAGEILVSRLLL